MNPYLNQPFVVALDGVSEDLYELKEDRIEGFITNQSYDRNQELVDNPDWRQRVETAFGHGDKSTGNYLMVKQYVPFLNWKKMKDTTRIGTQFLTDEIKYGYNQINSLKAGLPTGGSELLKNYLSNLIYFDYDFNSPVTYNDMISGKILFKETTYNVRGEYKKYHCKLYLRGDYSPFKGAYQIPNGGPIEYAPYSYRENPTFKNGEFFIMIDFYYSYPVPKIKTSVHNYASITGYKTRIVFVPTFEAMEKYNKFQKTVVEPLIWGQIKDFTDYGNSAEFQKIVRKVDYLQFEYRMDNFGNIGNIPLAILPKSYSTKTRPLMMMNYMPKVFRFSNKNN